MNDLGWDVDAVGSRLYLDFRSSCLAELESGNPPCTLVRWEGRPGPRVAPVRACVSVHVCVCSLAEVAVVEPRFSGLFPPLTSAFYPGDSEHPVFFSFFLSSIHPSSPPFPADFSAFFFILSFLCFR